MATRYLSPGVRAALTALSTQTCYYPSCTAPLLDKVDGKYRMGLEIAHIRALNEDGARYDESMTDAERNDFPNLIYLCTKHHRAVDGDEEKYDVDTLHGWKEYNESGQQRFTSGGNPVTEEILESAIGEALRERDADIQQTLERLRATDAEAAELMQQLRDELRAARNAGSIIDPDDVARLSGAADTLEGLNLYDAAALLSQAAERVAVQVSDMQRMM